MRGNAAAVSEKSEQNVIFTADTNHLAGSSKLCWGVRDCNAPNKRVTITTADALDWTLQCLIRTETTRQEIRPVRNNSLYCNYSS